MIRSASPILVAALGLAAGCAPRFYVQPPASIQDARASARVSVLPIRDLRPDPLEVSTGYVGIFQQRQDIRAHEETPPANVLGQALSDELFRRGMSAPAGDTVRVACTMPEFVLRFRNYAGAYSATDGWGYLDLDCRVQQGGRVIWQGPVFARHHRAYYVSFQGWADAIWPSLSGALVQQAAGILNRFVFREPASPELVQRASALLSSESEDDRFEGAYRLGVTGDPGVVSILLHALDDPSKKVRRSVVDALGTLGAREALPELLARFDGEDGNVQWATIKAILQIGDPQGFAWLHAHAPSIKADTLREIVDDTLAHEPGGR